VLDHVYENFFSLIPYDRIGLALLEEGRAVVRAHWARSEATEIKLPLGYSASLANSSLAEIILTGKPRILNDLESYLESHPQSDSTRRIVAEGMRSSLTCPLMAKGEPFGFLFFSSMTKNTYTGDHQELFLQIAGQLAVILEKSRLYENLLRLTEQLQVAKVALEQEATRDSLTELWNRRSILDLLKREIARAARDGKPLAAIMIDIDRFKPVNDRIGHLAGDEVLREITCRVAATLRSADVLGRIGGEEFLIILYPADERTAFEVMERARLACSARPVEIDDRKVDITISLGAAVAASAHEVELTDLLTTADRALYRAKNGGRNRSAVETLA
jgi:diguanylate cyclase (GGDEF)-like protein